MNTPITRLYVGVLLLFALLVGFTSNWSVFDAEQLEAEDENKRPLLEAQQIERGKILTVDGETIATSIQKGRGEGVRFVREYPEGSLFGNPVGYSFITQGNSGLERSENDTLTGEENEFISLIDQVRGQAQEGSDIVTTLDASAQRVATESLAGQGSPGAVVAIEPETGAVRVMASTPGYDPNLVPTELKELNQAEPPALLDRTVQSVYPPGSTMKVVTAAAALDSGEFTPDTTLDSSSPQEFSGVDLANSGNAQFGTIDMRTALTNSVNTYWAQVGETLGPETLVEYMKRFGFFKDPEVQLPDDQKAPSGVYALGKDGNELVEDGFDIARVAIGQGGEEGQLLATPMQMAEVAATVANGGTLMRPTLVQEVRDPDGRVAEDFDPEEQSEVISEEAAAQLAEMMTSVVDEGTAAALAGDLGGTTFAGKTGTAEKDIEAGINQVWFIGFAPADDPQIAIATTVETCTGCFGGDTAGPIATAVMNDLLNGG
jgi:penicillin-binding protein A